MHRFRILPCIRISIHALRVEGDTLDSVRHLLTLSISIHALRVEGDSCTVTEERNGAFISIHALRVEGDSWLQGVFKTDWTISIHALRVEGDNVCRLPVPPTTRDFYPRPPGGGRREKRSKPKRRRNFYPRPPGGGRRFFKIFLKNLDLISIHALRVEGDLHNKYVTCTTEISIHALRVEGDIYAPWKRIAAELISIHALRVEGDFFSALSKRVPPDFYPRPPGGGRPNIGDCAISNSYFYPRPPGGGRLVWR